MVKLKTAMQGMLLMTTVEDKDTEKDGDAYD